MTSSGPRPHFGILYLWRHWVGTGDAKEVLTSGLSAIYLDVLLEMKSFRVETTCQLLTGIRKLSDLILDSSSRILRFVDPDGALVV